MTGAVATIVVAGGTGLRFGSRKQFAELAGRSVLQRSVEPALAVSSQVVVVVPEDALDNHGLEASPLLSVVAGGDSRAASVRAGLDRVDDSNAFVLVHDAARPLASIDLFRRVLHALVEGASAVVPAVAMTDTVRQIDGGVVDRSSLRAVQTPQGFRREVLVDAHASAADATDDASLVEAIGGTVVLVDGEVTNRKITDPVDLDLAAILLSRIEPR